MRSLVRNTDCCHARDVGPSFAVHHGCVRLVAAALVLLTGCDKLFGVDGASIRPDALDAPLVADVSPDAAPFTCAAPLLAEEFTEPGMNCAPWGTLAFGGPTPAVTNMNGSLVFDLPNTHGGKGT